MPSENSQWLLDAEVRSRITYEHGRWVVSLLFIDSHDPTHFILKRINDFRSERLAQIAARYMQQTAEKDPRGTQKINSNAHNSHNN